MKITSKIKRARKLKGLTQKQLAEKSGLDSKTISHYEADRRIPNTRNLRKLANALDMPISYFIDDEGKQITFKNWLKTYDCGDADFQEDLMEMATDKHIPDEREIDEKIIRIISHRYDIDIVVDPERFKKFYLVRKDYKKYLDELDGTTQKNMGRAKLSEFLCIAKTMPSLPHKEKGKAFDITQSKVCAWLGDQPELLYYLYIRCKDTGIITYDKETGLWQGVEYKKADSDSNNT